MSVSSHLKTSAGMSSGPGALLFLTAVRMFLSSLWVIGCILTGLLGWMTVELPVYVDSGAFQCELANFAFAVFECYASAFVRLLEPFDPGPLISGRDGLCRVV